MPPLNLDKHGPYCISHSKHHIIALHYLVFIAYFPFLCVCLLLPDRHQFRGERGGVLVLPSFRGSCLCFYCFSDKRAFLPGYLFFFCCFAFLLYSGLVLSSCQVSYHMLPSQAKRLPPPTNNCCLVYRVSLWSPNACFVSLLHLVTVISIVSVMLSGYLLGDQDTCFMVIHLESFTGYFIYSFFSTMLLWVVEHIIFT
jgi:hypothetical protein